MSRQASPRSMLFARFKGPPFTNMCFQRLERNCLAAGTRRVFPIGCLLRASVLCGVEHLQVAPDVGHPMERVVAVGERSRVPWKAGTESFARTRLASADRSVEPIRVSLARSGRAEERPLVVGAGHDVLHPGLG